MDYKIAYEKMKKVVEQVVEKNEAEEIIKLVEESASKVPDPEENMQPQQALRHMAAKHRKFR